VSAVPTIHDLLELSTAHLPAHLADRLSAVPGINACATVYGWLMWIPDPDDDLDAIPGGCDVLVTIQRYAQTLGCGYVLFDRDGDLVDDLPHWDW
jgi:hypothetical protein